MHAYETSPMLSNPISVRGVDLEWPAQRMAHTVLERIDCDSVTPKRYAPVTAR